MHNLNDDHMKSASSISQQLDLAVAHISAAPAQAACSCKLPSLNKSWQPHPSPPAKMSKTPIRVDLLVVNKYQYSRRAEPFSRQDDSKLMKESVKHLAKTT
jgi:hypothetical protein